MSDLNPPVRQTEDDRAFEEQVVHMMLDVEDDAIAEALRDRDAEALTRMLGLSEREATLAVEELLPISDNVFDRAVARGLDRAGLGGAFAAREGTRSPGDPARTEARRSGRGVMTKRLFRVSALVAPLAAAAAVVLLLAPARMPELPSYRLDPLALGETMTKAAPLPEPPREAVVWRPGTTFHVRLRAEVGAAPDETRASPPTEVGARAFLRTKEETLELPLTVEPRPDGLHVFGTVGRTISAPRGRHELVVAVHPSGHAPTAETAAGWTAGTEREDGYPLFWFEVDVKPARVRSDEP